jgi:pimeloyl-ACP methyl ester carboxylesterase
VAAAPRTQRSCPAKALIAQTSFIPFELSNAYLHIFDGLRIAYHDEGEGPVVILLHGFGVDGLGQFGDFERILPLLEKRQEMFCEVFGGAPPLPNPPPEGRPGVVRALLAAGARVILPDMRGFGASDKRETKPRMGIQRWLATSSLSSNIRVLLPLM